MADSVLNCSICLSDLKEGAVKIGKNNKKYLNFSVSERREPSQYGQTHSIVLSKSKEEREAKAPNVYIGDGKIFHFENRDVQTQTEDTSDDLPF